MTTRCKGLPAVVIELHEKGYTEDFEMREGLLFWIQEQHSVPMQEFCIAETYQLQTAGKQQQLHGVFWKTAGLRGILICPTKGQQLAAMHKSCVRGLR